VNSNKTVTMPFEPGKIPEGAKPFKKGVTGNPKGRPKLPDLSAAIAKVLSEEKDGLTALDAILAALRAKAAKGDVRAAQELLDRGFGKAKQSIDHTTAGEPLIFNFKDNA
jgi:hypothetical protein